MKSRHTFQDKLEVVPQDSTDPIGVLDIEVVFSAEPGQYEDRIEFQIELEEINVRLIDWSSTVAGQHTCKWLYDYYSTDKWTERFIEQAKEER